MHPEHVERAPRPLASGVQVTPERTVIINRANELIIIRISHTDHLTHLPCNCPAQLLVDTLATMQDSQVLGWLIPMQSRLHSRLPKAKSLRATIPRLALMLRDMRVERALGLPHVVSGSLNFSHANEIGRAACRERGEMSV